MTNPSFTPKTGRLVLKEPVGWFAAGDSFRKALNVLSDGAFKLYAFLCLEADRRTGRYKATQKELAMALEKSKRIVGAYVAELQAKEICDIEPGKNQFAPTVFRISDSYWPYHRSDESLKHSEQESYIASVREGFLSLGCVIGKFGAAEVQAARNMQIRGIPVAVIQDAMLLGACRKYTSWLNGEALEPIRSLAYFEPLIAEVQSEPLPPGYSAYLRRKVQKLEESWKDALESINSGVSGKASIEIVQ